MLKYAGWNSNSIRASRRFTHQTGTRAAHLRAGAEYRPAPSGRESLLPVLACLHAPAAPALRARSACRRPSFALSRSSTILAAPSLLQEAAESARTYEHRLRAQAQAA